MLPFNLNQQFITEIALESTARAYPKIRYADTANLLRPLFARVGWFPAASGTTPRNVYVLFLGSAEAIEKHQPAIADICSRGNELLIFEYSGQGRSGRFHSDPKKVHAQRAGFDMWIDAMREFLHSGLFRAVRERALKRDAHLVAIAYSYGGHLFARMTLETPAYAHRFTRIVYVNPVIAMNTAGTMAMRYGQQFLARYRIIAAKKVEEYLPGHGGRHPGDRPLEKSPVGTDAERHEWLCRYYFDNPDLTMWGMTYGWFDEANRSIVKLWEQIFALEARKGLSLWQRMTGKSHTPNPQRVPTLVIASRHDTLVVWHYVRRFARVIDADLLTLRTAKHEPTQEPPAIREATLKAVGAWVADPDAKAITDQPDMLYQRARRRPARPVPSA